MAKPRNLVNFYASAGATYFMNDLSQRDRQLIDGVYTDNGKIRINDNKVGINFGVGVFVNINAGKAGTFCINAE